jgi:hypothetical protein
MPRPTALTGPKAYAADWTAAFNEAHSLSRIGIACVYELDGYHAVLFDEWAETKPGKLIACIRRLSRGCRVSNEHEKLFIEGE